MTSARPRKAASAQPTRPAPSQDVTGPPMPAGIQASDAAAGDGETIKSPVQNDSGPPLHPIPSHQAGTGTRTIHRAGRIPRRPWPRRCTS